MTPFTLTSFGPASAPKAALLFCGSWQVGFSWWSVAEKLVNAGYRVDYPDIPFSESSYTVDHLVQYYLANLSVPAAGYDIVGGINAGALVALKLAPHLPTPPRRLVLLEPPLGGQPPPPVVDMVKKIFEQRKSEPDDGPLRKQMGDKVGPLDVSAKRIATILSSAERIVRISGDNADASHDWLPASAGRSEIVVVGGDPKGSFKVYDPEKWAPLLKDKYPFVNLVYFIDSGHDVVSEAPAQVAQVMLGTAEEWGRSKDIHVVQ